MLSYLKSITSKFIKSTRQANDANNQKASILIPSYLQKRSIKDYDVEGLKLFFKEYKLENFSDLTIDLINNFAQKNYEAALNLCHLLGLYGVVFEGRKAQQYSSNERNEICLIKTDLSEVDLYQIPFDNKNNPKLIQGETILLNTLKSKKINTLAQLNGINLSVLLDKAGLKDANINDFIELFTNLKMEVKTNNFESFYLLEPEVFMNNNIESEDNEEILHLPLKNTNLSLRTFNTLARNNIITIEDLLKLNLDDIYLMKNAGQKTVDEVKIFLSQLNIKLPNSKEFIAEQKLEDKCSNLNQEKQDEVNDQYYILIKDIPFPDFIKKIFLDCGIKNIGQLVQHSPEEILSRDEDFMQRNDWLDIIENINQYLISIGFQSYPLVLPQGLKQRLNEYALDEILSSGFLNILINEMNLILNSFSEKEIEVFKHRYGLYSGSDKKTLEQVGQIYGVTRERIRQIEKRVLPRIKKQFGDKLGMFNRYANLIFQEYGVIFKFNGDDEVHNYQKVLNDIFDDFSLEFKIDFKNFLILSQNFNIESLHAKVLSMLGSKDTEIVQLQEIKHLFYSNLKTTLIIKDEQTENNFKSIFEALFEDFINESFIKIEGEQYKSITNTEKSSNNRNEKIINLLKMLYPEGIHLPINNDKELTKNLEQIINKLSKQELISIRTISDGVIKRCSNVLLWRRGTYIHVDNVTVNWGLVDEAINEITRLFDDNIAHFRIQRIFNVKAEEYIQNGIPEATSLLSLIKYKNNERIGFSRSEIFDKINIDKFEDKVSLMEKYLLESKTWVEKSQLQEYFCIQRGWEEYEIESYYYRCNNIKRDSSFGFIHISNLNIDDIALEEISQRILSTVEKLNATINLKIVKQEYAITWNSIVGFNVQPAFIGSLLADQKNLPYIIENNIYVKPLDSDYNGSTTFAEILNDWVKEQCLSDKYVLNSQLYEFCQNHGFNSYSVVATAKNIGLLEYDTNAYVHPEVIGYNEEWVESLKDVVQAAADEAYSNNEPYIKYSTILNNYSDDLPQVNENYFWNTHLLRSILAKIVLCDTFYSSFIITNNQFKVEDLDDLAGFLMAKIYKDEKCTLKDLDRMMAQKEIIEFKSINSLKPKLFFDGSSIQLIDEGTNVILSKIGCEKYLNV